MTSTDSLLRELNHRVQNNFQIIVSLMNLKRRTLPIDRQEDIRFLQEHVQSMAVAYRLVYATGSMTEVPVGELMQEVIGELRQIARLGIGQVVLTGGDIERTMTLDQAIAFGLYLAVVLPPFLDHAARTSQVVSISASVEDVMLSMSIRGQRAEPDALRRRLDAAYIQHLNAEKLSDSDLSEVEFRMPLAQ